MGSKVLAPHSIAIKMVGGSVNSEITDDLSGIVINISDFCNIHCTYCFEAKSREVVTDSDNYSNILGIISSAAQRPRRSPFSVSFYGGEPLAHFAAITQMVSDIEKKVSGVPIKFSVATNGLLLNGKREEYLRARDFHIQVSIDGPAHVIDKHRLLKNGAGSSGQLSQLVNRIRSFPDIMARPTITPQTAQHFAETIAYLIEIGFDCRSRPIKFDFDLTAEWSEEQFSDLQSSMKEASEYLSNHYFEGGMARILPLDRVFQLWRPKESKDGSGGYCGAGCSMIHANSKGHLYPCSRLTASHNVAFSDLRLDQGNARNKVMADIHPGIDRKPACATCMARHFCEQTCPARIHAGSGSFSKISDKQCRTIRYTHKLGRDVLVPQLLEPNAGFEEAYRL